MLVWNSMALLAPKVLLAAIRRTFVYILFLHVLSPKNTTVTEDYENDAIRRMDIPINPF